MHLSLAIPLLAANLVAALPKPQEIDLDMVIAMPDPTYSEAVGVTAQVVTYDVTSAVAQATAAASSISVAVTDVLSSTAEAKRFKRTACASQPAGATGAPTVSDLQSPEAFESNAGFSSLAVNAATPTGYTKQFQNLNASNSAYGYMGFSTLDNYDTVACANQCNAINGCMSFNLYFERDPSVDPGTGCADPDSVTMIKCVFWGGPVNTANANNYGQWRDEFQVVIAGSNGYTNNSIIVPSGFSTAIDLGNAAINAPYDAQGYNTYMGATIFTSGPFNASLCADYCTAQTKYNVATASKDGTPPKICNFFNTYILTLNGNKPQGQYCALYTEAWTSTYATNTGQYRGSDVYTVDHSYAFSNSTSQAPAPAAGDKKGAIYQARQDMTYYSSQLTATYQPYCSTYLATATVTSTPAVLTKYPATVISSACSLITTSATATSASSGSGQRQ